MHSIIIHGAGQNGDLKCYCSVRRKPNERRLHIVQEIYAELLAEEKGEVSGLQVSEKMLLNMINKEGKFYEE